MPYLLNQGLRLHYEVHGNGQPVVLLHGGAVNFEHNYAAYGWIKQLNDRGLQVIGLDFRGHGKSDKPHDIESYGTANLASDVTALLDHLQLSRTALVAYSIGTAVALHLLLGSPERFSKAALVATGDGMIGIPPHTLARITPALAVVVARTEYPRDLPRHVAAYWNLVEQTAGDRAALQALARASYPPLSVGQAAVIRAPILVISGENDPVLGRGPTLASSLGNGEYLEVAGADHFSLAVDVGTQAAVGGFLSREAAGPLQ